MNWKKNEISRFVLLHDNRLDPVRIPRSKYVSQLLGFKKKTCTHSIFFSFFAQLPKKGVEKEYDFHFGQTLVKKN